ncbi:MAG: hypothetical protein HC773_11645, partial [Scytonema sp. CRU_2_7]|nr:hypothetical protein [Scytonema sp. CRU_2_7]
MNPRSRRKSAAISPQLPRFVQSQNRMISPAAVWEPSSELDSDRDEFTVSAVSQVISNTTFPHLRRLKASQDETEDITPDYEPVECQEHTTEIQNEDAAQSVVEETQFQNESFHEDAAQLAKDDALPQDASFVKLVIPDHSQFITTGSPNISPLIRRWMHTQGYSLPEPINLQKDYDTSYIVASKDQVFDEVNKGTRGQGDKGTRGLGDKGTRGLG